MINYLIPLTITCLFLPFKTQFGPVQVRPFDAMVVVLLLVSVPQIRLMFRTKISIGLLFIVAFLTIHVLSAFSYTGVNGLRELLQASLVLMLAFLIHFHSERLDFEKAGRVLLIGCITVMAFNIIWHVGNGFWSGWKRLLDPKALFTLFPMLLGLFLIFSHREQRQIYWLLWFVVGLAVFLSGERKALLAFLILSVSFFGRGQLRTMVPLVVVGLLALSIVSDLTNNRYLARQLDSVLNPSLTQLSLGAMAEGYSPTSMSNASREFQIRQSAEFISKYPLFGVGTNAYTDIVNMRFASLPKYLRAGVHNEFLRVLVENGLVGLLIYLSLWLVSIARVSRLMAYMTRRRIIDRTRARLFIVTAYIPSLFYVSFEASGTRVIMIGVVVSLLPDLLRTAYLRRRHLGFHANPRTELVA
jgi:hypothetical protein